MPTVLLTTTMFASLVEGQSRVLGLPSLPAVVLPHPIGGTKLESVLIKLDAAFDQIIDSLTHAISASSPSVAQKAQESEWTEIAVHDEWLDLQDTFIARGWSDGLPFVPPTESRIAAMLKYVDLESDYVLGAIPPRLGIATAEKVAANAVMAGCRPQHMPILLAAIKAMLEPSFNLYGIQTTTHCVAPLLVVNGPVANALNVHGGHNLFGPGPWANGVLGRAIRLFLLNLGGGQAGEVDKATMGHPGKYSFCIAENEAANPWTNLRVDRGFDPEESTVTVIGAEAPHNINDHESTSAGGLLTTIVGTMAQTGQNNVHYQEGEPLLILSPEHAETIASEGFSKDDVRCLLYEEARIPLYRFSAENIERRMVRKYPKQFKNRPLDTRVPIAQSSKDIMILVAGGGGKHSMYLPTFGGTRSVTCAIKRANGRPWIPSDFVT